MAVAVADAYLAELHGMQRLAELPRPKVPYAPETIHGAFCLWRTNGDGSHVDNIRLDPRGRAPVAEILRGVQSSPLRVHGGSILVRTVADAIGEDDAALLDRLASSPQSTGYLMARSLDRLLDEPQPRLRDTDDARVRVPDSITEYLEVRRLVARVFGGGSASYDPDTDFYSAPETMTYLAVRERGQIIAAASILIVDGIANVWSVCTEEAARGQGAASLVTHACLVEAHRQGAEAAALGTSRELAKPGGLYNRLGFDVVGHEHGWRLEDFDRIELSD